MANVNRTKVITGKNTRLSYFHGWEPVSINGGAEKYSVSVLIPKDDTETINAINVAVDAAIEEGIAKFGGKKPNKGAIKLPLRDGDVERDDDAYKGHYFVNANSTTAPQIVDKAVKPILDRDEVYSGCYARCGECGGVFKRRRHYKPSGEYIAWCCTRHIVDKHSCSMKYITDDGIKAAFLTMMNKLTFANQPILKTLLHSLQGFDDKDRLLKIQEYENLLEKNVEQRQVLTSLMASGLLESALFNKENNTLTLEEQRLQEEKRKIMTSVSGDRTKVEALEKLIKAVSSGQMLTEFSDEVFLAHVDGITVLSREEIVFELKCGLKLKERLVG